MRIVAGRFRGVRLAGVGKGDPGAHLRPTQDRVRESLFSILTSLDVIEGARVLDLFAGTGALGLEALSRGAERAVFVENGRVGGGLIGRNIELTRSGGETRLMRADATRLGACDEAPFTLLFLDPPYGGSLGKAALAAAKAGGWIAPGALVVWEENAPQEPPPGFELHDVRKYGETYLTLLWREG